jgi:hypothetical protein
MYLKIRVDCPLCAGQTTWIYDTEAGERHRGSQGCPGGCTAIQQIGIYELSEDDAKEFLKNEKYPKNSLDL